MARVLFPWLLTLVFVTASIVVPIPALVHWPWWAALAAIVVVVPLCLTALLRLGVLDPRRRG